MAVQSSTNPSQQTSPYCPSLSDRLIPPKAEYNYQVSTGLGRDLHTFQAVKHLGWNEPSVTNEIHFLTFPDGPPKRYRQKYEHAVQLVLYNCFCIHVHEQRSGKETLALISRHKASCKMASEYRSNDIGHPVLMKVLDRLEDLRFIQQNIGTRSALHAHGISSSFGLTDRSRDWLNRNGNLFTCGRFTHNTELIRLKETKAEARNRGTGPEIQLYIPYQDRSHPTVRLKRQAVKSLNRINSQHVFTYRPCLQRRYEWDGLNRIRHAHFSACYHTVPTEQIQYHRVFHGNFQQTGRFHCDAQGLMKEERETLLIDGLPTVELDFKSLHPRMLYHLQGLDAPEDCHQANGDYPREVIKGLCMRVLNTTDRSACIKSIDKMFTEEFDGVLKGQYNPKQLLSDYEDFHEPIRNLFYSEQWLRLQHLDSVMAQKIMSAFTRRGLPILGIHDSFIVQDRYEEDLRREMSLAYQSILQREPLITPYR